MTIDPGVPHQGTGESFSKATGLGAGRVATTLQNARCRIARRAVALGTSKRGASAVARGTLATSVTLLHRHHQDVSVATALGVAPPDLAT
jgi:hypothetical protein